VKAWHTGTQEGPGVGTGEASLSGEKRAGQGLRALVAKRNGGFDAGGACGPGVVGEGVRMHLYCKKGLGDTERRPVLLPLKSTLFRL
jgi:hypothetical protein